MKIVKLNKDQYHALVTHLELVETLPTLMAPSIPFNYMKAFTFSSATLGFKRELNKLYQEMSEINTIVKQVALVYKDALIAIATLDFDEANEITKITSLDSELIASDKAIPYGEEHEDFIVDKVIFDSSEDNSIMSLYYKDELMDLFKRHFNNDGDDTNIEMLPGYEYKDEGIIDYGGIEYKNSKCTITIGMSKKYHSDKTIMTMWLTSKLPYILDDLVAIFRNKILFTSHSIPHNLFLKSLGDNHKRIRYVHMYNTLTPIKIHDALITNGYNTDSKKETGVYYKDCCDDIILNYQRNRCFIISDAFLSDDDGGSIRCMFSSK